MRRHLALFPAALAAAIVSLWLCAGAALAAGSTTTASTTTASTTTAATTTPPTTTTPTTTTPTTPTPAPVAAQAKLTLLDTFTVHRDSVTVPHRLVEIHGVVAPYVAGQSVQVKAYLGKRQFTTDTLRIKPAAGGAGAFTERLQSPGSGIVRVQVVHARTPQMLAFMAQRAFAALDTTVRAGARGLFVDLLQQRLDALHLYLPASGVFDLQTQLALDAYHRLLGWGEGNESVDAKTVTALLNGEGAFHVRFPGHGRHAEGDLSDQVLALADGSKVIALFPISSGKPSTPTVLGDYRVYYRVPGYLPDGMYYSDFFYSGYAIHGYDPAPDYPASHGCMRLPISDAIWVFNWLNYGDWVDVYYT